MKTLALLLLAVLSAAGIKAPVGLEKYALSNVREGTPTDSAGGNSVTGG